MRSDSGRVGRLFQDGDADTSPEHDAAGRLRPPAGKIPRHRYHGQAATDENMLLLVEVSEKALVEQG